MADVRALPGIRYDPTMVGDLGSCVAPPWDVISEAELPLLRSRSPYNVVRLTHPGQDHAGAGALIRLWLEQGVLRRERSNAMYLHEVSFEGRRRRDLIAALRLQPFSDEVVLPHELTHKGAKEDRLDLFRATAASLEPLWFLYAGAGTHLPALLGEGLEAAADVSFQTAAGHQHRFWVVRDEGWQAAVRASFSGLPLMIADGHHRYSTALTHAEEMGGPSGASSRFTLALLTDLRDPGLLVRPIHRVLRTAVQITGGAPAGSLEETLEAIRGRVAAGLYQAGRYQVLPLDGELPALEVHQQVIDLILGRRAAEASIIYTSDAAEAVRWVDEGRGEAAFLLAAPDLARVLKLAQEGKTLPQKSTYFYPKPPTGMLFMRLDPNQEL